MFQMRGLLERSETTSKKFVQLWAQLDEFDSSFDVRAVSILPLCFIPRAISGLKE